MERAIHLDTANWINLSRDPALASQLDRVLSTSELVPCLSLIHLFEFARPERETTRSDVTSYIDQVCDRHGVLWVKARERLEIEEIRTELFRQMGIEYVPGSTFVKTLPESMDHDRTGEDLESWKRWTFERHVESLFKSPNYADDYRTFRRTEYLNFHQACKPPTPPVDKAIAMLPGRVELPNGKRLDVDLDQFRRNFQLPNCPVLEMTYAFNCKWVEGENADPRHLEDLFHLAAVAYAEAAFVDGETRNLLRQAGLPSDRLPMENGQFRQWLDEHASP